MQPRILTRTVYLAELAIGTVLFLIFAPSLFSDPGNLRGWAVVVWCFAIWWMRIEPGRPSWAFHLLADAAVLGIGLWLLYLDLAPLGDAAGRKAAMAAPLAFAATTIGELALIAPSFVALVFLSGDGESFGEKKGAEG